MRAYEIMFVVSPEYDEEATAQVIDKYSKVIEDFGGSVEKVNKWGKRKLAYEINGFTEGVYVVVDFLGNSEICDELERLFKISDEVVRYLIVRGDK